MAERHFHNVIPMIVNDKSHFRPYLPHTASSGDLVRSICGGLISSSAPQNASASLGDKNDENGRSDDVPGVGLKKGKKGKKR
jgi:hypothetical protein